MVGKVLVTGAGGFIGHHIALKMKKSYHLIVLATPHAVFARIKPADMCRGRRRVPLVDLWGMLRGNGFTNYFVPGVSK